MCAFLCFGSYSVHSWSVKPMADFLSLGPQLFKGYIKDITWWREDMNFMFEWQEQDLTSEPSERLRYRSATRT